MKISLLPRAELNYLSIEEENALAEKNKKTSSMVINCIYAFALIAAIASFFIFLPGFILFIGVVFAAAAFDPRVSVNVGSNITGYRTISDRGEKKLIPLITGGAVIAAGSFFGLAAHYRLNTAKLAIVYAVIAVITAFLIFGIFPIIKAAAASGRRCRCTVPAQAVFLSADSIEAEGSSDSAPIVAGCFYAYYYMGDGYKFYVSTKEAVKIDYKGQFDIMIDPGHPDKFYNERLMGAALGKSIKNAVLLLLAAGAFAALMVLAWKNETRRQKELLQPHAWTEEDIANNWWLINIINTRRV